MEPKELEKGDRVLFNDRKRPLKVTSPGGEAEVEGPGGGDYVLYEEDGTMLVAKKGNKRYSSYLEDLRKVGEWEKKGENLWRHSKTGSEVELSEEDGFWRLESDVEHNIEVPGMGYMERKPAEEDAQKIMDRNPEGKG